MDISYDFVVYSIRFAVWFLDLLLLLFTTKLYELQVDELWIANVMQILISIKSLSSIYHKPKTLASNHLLQLFVDSCDKLWQDRFWFLNGISVDLMRRQVHQVLSSQMSMCVLF